MTWLKDAIEWKQSCYSEKRKVQRLHPDQQTTRHENSLDQKYHELNRGREIMLEGIIMSWSPVFGMNDAKDVAAVSHFQSDGLPVTIGRSGSSLGCQDASSHHTTLTTILSTPLAPVA